MIFLGKNRDGGVAWRQFLNIIVRLSKLSKVSLLVLTKLLHFKRNFFKAKARQLIAKMYDEANYLANCVTPFCWVTFMGADLIRFR